MFCLGILHKRTSNCSKIVYRQKIFLMKIESVIKVILAALLLLCMFNMPYGYYQFVRFLAMIGLAILAYKSYERQEKVMAIVYVGFAILFQPLIKISLGSEIWNIVDAIVGLGLIVTIFIKPKTEKN